MAVPLGLCNLTPRTPSKGNPRWCLLRLANCVTQGGLLGPPLGKLRRKSPRPGPSWNRLLPNPESNLSEPVSLPHGVLKLSASEAGMSTAGRYWLFVPQSKKVNVLVDYLCPTVCDPIDCSPPAFSVHGILQARILEWIAVSFSSRSSWPRD